MKVESTQPILRIDFRENIPTGTEGFYPIITATERENSMHNRGLNRWKNQSNYHQLLNINDYINEAIKVKEIIDVYIKN